MDNNEGLTRREAENLFNIGQRIGYLVAKGRLNVNDNCAMWDISMGWARDFEVLVNTDENYIVNIGGYFEAIDTYTDDMLRAQSYGNFDGAGTSIWEENNG